jgi:hypothetical protein
MTEDFCLKYEGKAHLEDPGIDGTIILKLILKCGDDVN